jgi:hypothetical protein
MSGRSPAECDAALARQPGTEKCIALIYEGVEAIGKIRDVLGPTDPSKAPPGFGAAGVWVQHHGQRRARQRFGGERATGNENRQRGRKQLPRGGGRNTDEFMKLNDVQVVASCNIDKGTSRNPSMSSMALQKEGRQNLPRLPENDGAPRYRRGHDRRAGSLARIGRGRSRAEPEGHLRGKAAGQNHCRTAAHRPAVREHGRIWQTGSWQRSSGSFHKAAEIVRNGLIGKVTRVEVGLPSGHTDFAKTGQLHADHQAAA